MIHRSQNKISGLATASNSRETVNERVRATPRGCVEQALINEEE